jgi:hypothetical protein
MRSGIRRLAPPGFGCCQLGPGPSRRLLEIVASALRAVVGAAGLEVLDLALPVAREGSKEPQAIGHDGLPASRGPAPRRPRRPAQAP